jgi:hypothetical protein
MCCQSPASPLQFGLDSGFHLPSKAVPNFRNDELLEKVYDQQKQVYVWQKNPDNPNDDVMSYTNGRLAFLPHPVKFTGIIGETLEYIQINEEGLAVYEGQDGYRAYLLVNAPLAPGAKLAITAVDGETKVLSIIHMDGQGNVVKSEPAIFSEEKRPIYMAWSR